MTENLSHLHEVIDNAVIDDRENGVIRAMREIFTDEEVFELEMKYIFEGELDLPGPRVADPERRRLLHDQHRPHPRRDHPGQG